MNIELIIEVLKYVVIIGLGGLSFYLKTKTDLMDIAKNKISEAEDNFSDLTNAGGQKFSWVVDTIYDFVPAGLKLIFTKETIGELVQRTFNQMERYACLQLNKVADKIEDKAE